MEILVDNQIDRNVWADFFACNSFSTPFQIPSYFDFYNTNKNIYAKAFAVVQDGVIKALSVVTIQKEKGIKSFFSRRAVIYGGPLFDVNEPKAAEFLIDHIIAYLKNKVIFIEIRNLHDYSFFSKIFLSKGSEYKPYLNIKLKVRGLHFDVLVKQMKYNKRREIRLSIEQGATYRLCETIDELKRLYYILEDLYVSRVKLPLPEFSYFENLFKLDLAKVFLVEHESNIIGGAICPYFCDIGLYTLYYCGKRDYHKNIFPTHLAVLAVIEYASQNNFPEIDFMGAGLKGKAYNVRDYKLGFGGELVEHGRFVFIMQPLLYKLGILILKFIRRKK